MKEPTSGRGLTGSVWEKMTPEQQKQALKAAAAESLEREKSRSTQAEAQIKAFASIQAGGLGVISRGPRIANQLVIEIPTVLSITFSTGLYLVLSAGEGGKSVTSLALCALAKAAGVPEVGHLYVFEPGAREYAALGRVLFERPDFFLIKGSSNGDLDVSVEQVLTKETTASSRFLVVDSINDPIKSYNPEGRIGSGTSEGGMQQEDRAFCTKLNNWALARDTVLLGTVNTENIPFANKLVGVVEGMITVHRPGVFAKRERSTGRRPKDYTLPKAYIDIGAAAMGYTEQSAPMGATTYQTGAVIDY